MKLRNHEEHAKHVAEIRERGQSLFVESTRKRIEDNLSLANELRTAHLKTRKRQHSATIEHARQVAKKHHEQIRDDRERLLLHIENKHERTSSRRLMLSLIPRAKLQSRNILDLKLKFDAAVLIQRFYRKAKLSSVLKIHAKFALRRHQVTRDGYKLFTKKMQAKVPFK